MVLTYYIAYMTRLSSIYTLAALLCTALLFSCTPELEQPPPPQYGIYSSADIEQPPWSQPNELVSSATITKSSSSTQVLPISSPTQSSANVQNSSSSQSAQKSSSSRAQIVSGCAENNPKEDFYCGWNVAGNFLLPGIPIEPEYSGEDDCSISWKYKDEISPLADCLQTNENGLISEGSKTYLLFAELNCGGTKHTNACTPTEGLSSKRAPGLTGSCIWSKNPTTTARGATPSGVAVSDPDKICTSPTVVYKYNGGTKTWPSTGILPEWSSWDKKHTETYTDIEATLNCPAYPMPVTSQCPPLEVNAGADYLIECTGKFDDKSCKVGSTAGNSVNMKVDECVEINVMGYTDKYNIATVIMRCETQGTQQSASVTLSLNGMPTTTRGDWIVQPIVNLGRINEGDNEFGTLCVTALSGAASVTCKGPTQ